MRKVRQLLSAGAALVVLAGLLPTAAASALQQEEAATADLPDSYRIGPGDVLSIEFFGNPELDREVQVLRDGSISLPSLGSVPVGGMTPAAAAAELARLLEEGGLLKKPQVTIFVEQGQSRRVYLQGAVESPGAYELVGPTRLLQMIAAAGGLSGRVNGRAAPELYVIRMTEDGGQDRIEIDTWALMEAADAQANILLQPGDVIMVPPAEVHNVYVTGAVVRPGQVEFSSADGISVLQAVTAAGGPTDRANLKKVFILRRAADGGQERIQVNLKAIRKGREDDVALRNNDTVDVGEHFF